MRHRCAHIQTLGRFAHWFEFVYRMLHQNSCPTLLAFAPHSTMEMRPREVWRCLWFASVISAYLWTRCDCGRRTLMWTTVRDKTWLSFRKVNVEVKHILLNRRTRTWSYGTRQVRHAHLCRLCFALRKIHPYLLFNFLNPLFSNCFYLLLAPIGYELLNYFYYLNSSISNSYFFFFSSILHLDLLS